MCHTEHLEFVNNALIDAFEITSRKIKPKHGSASVGDPPPKRSRPQQSWIWSQLTPLHRSVPQQHPHFHTFRCWRRAAAERTKSPFAAEGEFPPMSPLHDRQEGWVWHARECQSGSHVWSIGHWCAELPGYRPAHSNRGAKRGLNKMPGCDFMYVWNLSVTVLKQKISKSYFWTLWLPNSRLSAQETAVSPLKLPWQSLLKNKLYHDFFLEDCQYFQEMSTKSNIYWNHFLIQQWFGQKL